MGAHRQRVRALDQATASAPHLVHRGEVRPHQHIEEPGAYPGPGEHPREHGEPGDVLSAAFTENLRPVLAAKGVDASDPVAINRWIAEEYGSPCDLDRAGEVEEIGPVIAFLVSRRNSYMTGANVNVDGGSDFT